MVKVYKQGATRSILRKLPDNADLVAIGMKMVLYVMKEILNRNLSGN